MARGRKPDPTRAKRQTGHREKPGEAKVTTIAPRVNDPGLPACPSDLPKDVIPMWDVAIAELWPRGIRESDLEAVRQMCNAAHRARQAAAYVEQYGPLVKGLHGPIANPMMKVERDYTNLYLKIAESYGLTLASRMRLGLMQLAGESLVAALNASLDGD